MSQALQFTSAAPDEQRRQLIVRLVMTLFVLLIFEGALRKWVAPELSMPLLFIRDPFLITIYYLALKQNRFAMRELLLLGLGISTLLVALALLQIAADFMQPLVGAYGIRNYILYIFLPIIMYTNMKSADVEQLLLILFRVSIPLGALGVAQSFLPVDHILNKGTSEGGIFVAGNQVRTYGTFSFTAGHAQYITFMVPLAAGALVYFAGSSKMSRWAALSLFSMCCAAVTSGSRGVMFGLGITALLYVGCILLIGGPRKTGQLIATALLVFSMSAVSLLAFSDQFENILERFRDADATEGSIVERAFSPLTRLTEAIGDGSFIGAGIGKGTGGGSYLSTGVQEFTLDEVETLRIIQECGAITGLLYIAFRILLLALCIRLATFSMTHIANPLPILLLSFIIPSLLVGQITLNNTANGFNWLGVGMLFSLSHLRPKQQP